MPKANKNLASNALCLALLFILALIPRLYSAQTMGWHWDSPGSFTLVNFDEGGSCRAVLKGFEYSTFIGHQTIALNEALGHPVPSGTMGNPQAAAKYCHSAQHIQAARYYSAVTGALTVVLIGMLGLLLVGNKPQVAWTAAALLALSGFHVSESHVGTVDAPSVFFIYAFLTLLVFAAKSKNRLALLASTVLLLFAVWTKYWVFAALAYIALTPHRLWQTLARGLSAARIAVLLVAGVVVFALVSNADFQATGLYPLLAAFYLLVPWGRISWASRALLALVPLLAYGLTTVDIIATYTTGDTTYAPIGWNKWLRNPLNTFNVLIVGLGLPACIFIPAGIKAIFRDQTNVRGWLCLAPIALFLAYMMFVAPVTYYRHYLPLIPAAALLAALGLWSTHWSGKRWFLALFFLWPALLMVDIETDYHKDPRVELRGWYERQTDRRIYFSYYANLPPQAMANASLFHPEFATGDATALRQAHYLVLSENWYDTAFANELNGPYVGKPERMIKTSPEYVSFYRQALAGNHPYLKHEQAFDVQNFMPELIVHSWFYGTFQMFVGDVKVFRIVQ